MDRRALLAKSGAALLTALAGCGTDRSPETADRTPLTTTDPPPSSTATDTSEPTIPIQTPAEGNCDPADRLRPMPDSPRARGYPTHPGSIDTPTVRSFATGYERAYRYNSRLPEFESVQVDVDSPEWAVADAQNGLAVGLDGRVQFDDPSTSSATATPLPSGFFEFAVWYYLTERFALRTEARTGPLEEGDEPYLRSGTIVACGSPDG